MKDSMRWILATTVLLTAPVVVHGWDGTRCGAHRLHAEIRREIRESIRELRGALDQAECELSRAREEEREAVRQVSEFAREIGSVVRRDARELRDRIR
jgi:hypothetical protein